ncbi:hypothetical protein BO71DRAFT_436852 [Aspergillus ellipticus CBS 707.79]|uniref:Aminoglycoside phosphotransferase domain-containing protein n=1 Tax=Aspergillus ellipticus CBS 707.79 TaxID=1448320 RepID=A0A319DRA7_9EURO|nr:hypothetical protein BO71DRAFT_436852 [Aspergillus ellipticus CBS 707.79]
MASSVLEGQTPTTAKGYLSSFIDVTRRMSPTSAAGIISARCMDYDDVAWAKGDEIFAPWRSLIFEPEVLRDIGRFIDKHRGGVPDELFFPKRGSFNAWLRTHFEDGGSTVIRLPCPGASLFPEEKVKREVAVMQFLEYFTNLRIHYILHHGMTEESPRSLGPFIIMEHFSNEGDFIDAINTPGRSRDDRPVLDPNVSQERLEFVYGQMADIMLQVSKYSLLIRGASSYYQALAEMHMIHLSCQRNDAIDSAEDCRQKFIARCLFRKIAREHQLSKDETGPFKLFCDDLRPGNVLANKDHVMTGMVDWEFTYVAPTGFAYSAPFWLLLELPELYEDGLDAWTRKYEELLPIFLKALKGRERAAIERGTIQETDCLSKHMLDSWESGEFWLNYAERKSWAFDMIYWAKIDRRFFGDGDLDDRIQLLTTEEREEMEGFVQMKLKMKEEGGLAEVENTKSETMGALA